MGIIASIAVPVFLTQRKNSWKSSVEADVSKSIVTIESVKAKHDGSFDGVTTDDGTPINDASMRKGMNYQVFNKWTGADITVSNGNTIYVTLSLDGRNYSITGTNSQLNGGDEAVAKGTISNDGNVYVYNSSTNASSWGVTPDAIGNVIPQTSWMMLAGASQSMLKLGSKTIATNLVVNPRFVSTGRHMWNDRWSSNWTPSLGTGDNTFGTYYRITRKSTAGTPTVLKYAGVSIGGNLDVSSISASLATNKVKAGKITVSYWFRSDKSLSSANIAVKVNNGNGEWTDTAAQGTTHAATYPTNQWNHVTSTFTLANSGYLTLKLETVFPSNDVSSVGNTVDFSGITVTTEDDYNAMKAIGVTWFDGSQYGTEK
jgi:hypothetical protein